jgi:two-component system NtrC family response regulator
LRDRSGDVPLLARFFVDRFCRDMKKKPLTISPAALDALVAYRWPGNVRELQNCIERSVILADGDAIQPRHLNLSFVAAETPPEPTNPLAELDLSGSLAEVTRRTVSVVERLKIEEALKEADNVKGRAAELLQMNYKLFLSKLKEYRLE